MGRVKALERWGRTWAGVPGGLGDRAVPRPHGKGGVVMGRSPPISGPLAHARGLFQGSTGHLSPGVWPTVSGGPAGHSLGFGLLGAGALGPWAPDRSPPGAPPNGLLHLPGPSDTRCLQK